MFFRCPLSTVVRVLPLCCGLIAGTGMTHLATQAHGQTSVTPKYIQSSAAAGTRVIRPNTWTMFSFEISNPTNADAKLLATSYFETNASLQFGRQVWVPPHARRRSWYAVRPPATIGQEGNLVNVHSLLIDRTDETAPEKIILSPSGEMLHHGLIAAKMERPATGILQGPEDDGPRNVVATARSARNLTIVMFELRSELMPPRAEVLDGLDQLVVANDQLLDDSAALSSVRRWLAGGGRVWVMLDKVSPRMLEQLVGPRVGWAPVDRVQLDSVTIQDDRPVTDKQKRQQTLTYDDPVEMVRGVFDKVDVMQSVNGWPAACWCNIGHGKLLLTTLEARGWYRHRTSTDVRNKDMKKRSNYAATESLELLAEQFLTIRETPVPAAEAFQSSVSSEIGHRILSRTTVASVLGGLCLGLVVVSGFCIWRQRTAVIGWLGPVAAMVAAFVLAFVGATSRNAIGRSFAVGQWIEADESFSDLRASGVLSMYNPTQWKEPLGSHGGGIFLPDELDQTGTTVRMVWTDTDRWHLENLTLESGIHFAPFIYTTSTNEVVRATATFGPDGLVGQLDTGPFDEISDAIIIAPRRAPIRVQWGKDHSFEARSTDVLTPGQFSGNAIISDEQRRRQEVLQILLNEDSEWQPAEGLTLLAWTKPLDVPFTVNDPERRAGSAILAVPVRLRRPAAGASVSVPPTLISYRAVPAVDGTMSSAYSNQQGKWVGELSTATQAKLRIALPLQVLPLEIKRLTVQIKIRAPQRVLEFIGHQGDDESVLLTKNSPVGTMRFTLPRSEYLQVNEQGGLLLTVHVGQHPDEASGSISNVGWKIDELKFGVEGDVGLSH